MEHKKPTAKEAVGLLSQVAAIYKGTLQEHSDLQESIAVLNEMVSREDILEDTSPQKRGS